MKITTEQLLKWADQLNAGNRVMVDPGELTSEQYHAVSMNVVRALFEMQDAFIRGGRFKDEWDDGTFSLHPRCTTVHRKAKKVGAEFTMYGDIEKLELRSWIKCDGLGQVGDDFWRSVLDLSTLGALKVEQSSGSIGPDNAPADLFKPRSVVFRMMRGHVLNALDTHPTPPTFDFTLTWKNEKFSIDDVMSKGQEAFRLLYGLHYAMWKVRSAKVKQDTR